MSIKLVTVPETTQAEIQLSTGSNEFLDKAGKRSYAGLYDDELNWYIPLHANLGNKPDDACFVTPFETSNPHFKKPGLDFQKAMYLPKEKVIAIENTMPVEQWHFILSNEQAIKEKFERYVLSTQQLAPSSNDYRFSTVPLFPEGIERIIHMKQSNDLDTALEVTRNFLYEVNENPSQFTYLIDEAGTRELYSRPGYKNEAIKTADFSDGLGNFYQFPHIDLFCEKLFLEKIDHDMLDELHEDFGNLDAEAGYSTLVEDMTWLDDMIDLDHDELYDKVKEAYLEKNDLFGISYNSTTNKHELAGVDEYFNKLVTEFEEDNDIPSRLLLNNLEFASPGAELQNLNDCEHIPSIEAVSPESVADIEYLTWDRTGKPVLFAATNLGFEPDAPVLNREQLEIISKAAFNVFEAQDFSLWVEDDLADGVMDDTIEFEAELGSEGLDVDAIVMLFDDKHDLHATLHALAQGLVLDTVNKGFGKQP